MQCTLKFTPIIKIQIFWIMLFLLSLHFQATAQKNQNLNDEIEQAPIADNYNITIEYTPGNDQLIALNGSFPTTGTALCQLTGKDYEDANSNQGLNGLTKRHTVVITTPIAALNNSTGPQPEMFYDGQSIQNHPISQMGGYVIKNYNADLLQVRVNGSKYTGFKFEYAWIDFSKIQGEPATYQVSWQNAPLPVTLVDFKLKQEQNTIQIAWSTSAEFNTQRFEIQRSKDASNWKTIHSLDAANNSNSLLYYEAIDSNPLYGLNYYRLKMIDTDGAFALSRIAQIAASNSSAKSMVYPNPVANEIIINGQEQSKIAKITVVNQNGMSVRNTFESLDANQNKYSINVRDVVNGLYFLNVEFQNGARFTEKVVIKK